MVSTKNKDATKVLLNGIANINRLSFCGWLSRKFHNSKQKIKHNNLSKPSVGSHCTKCSVFPLVLLRIFQIQSSFVVVFFFIKYFLTIYIVLEIFTMLNDPSQQFPIYFISHTTISKIHHLQVNFLVILVTLYCSQRNICTRDCPLSALRFWPITETDGYAWWLARRTH